MQTYTLENVVLVHETDAAWLLRMTYETEAEIPEEFETDVNQWWVAKSHIEATDIEEIEDQGYVEIPMWIARQKELPDT